MVLAIEVQHLAGDIALASFCGNLGRLAENIGHCLAKARQRVILLLKSILDVAISARTSANIAKPLDCRLSDRLILVCRNIGQRRGGGFPHRCKAGFGRGSRRRSRLISAKATRPIRRAKLVQDILFFLFASKLGKRAIAGKTAIKITRPTGNTARSKAAITTHCFQLQKIHQVLLAAIRHIRAGVAFFAETSGRELIIIRKSHSSARHAASKTLGPRRGHGHIPVIAFGRGASGAPKTMPFGGRTRSLRKLRHIDLLTDADPIGIADLRVHFYQFIERHPMTLCDIPKRIALGNGVPAIGIAIGRSAPVHEHHGDLCQISNLAQTAFLIVLGALRLKKLRGLPGGVVGNVASVLGVIRHAARRISATSVGNATRRIHSGIVGIPVINVELRTRLVLFPECRALFSGIAQRRCHIHKVRRAGLRRRLDRLRDHKLAHGEIRARNIAASTKPHLLGAISARARIRAAEKLLHDHGGIVHRRSATIGVTFAHVLGTDVPAHALGNKPATAVCALDDLAAVFETREEPGRRRGGRGRARQRASPHGDIAEELGHLERISALLKELVIERRQTSLIGLLLLSASAEKSLTTGKSRALSASTNAREPLPALHEAGKVRLPRREIGALLLLSNTLRLRKPLIEDVGHGLAIGKLLLLSEVCGGNAGTVTPSSTSLNGVAKLARHLLAKLLPHQVRRAFGDVLDVRVHVLLDIKLAQIGRPHPSHGRGSASLEIGLRHGGRLPDLPDGLLLRSSHGRNKGIGIGRIRLKGRLGYILSPRIDRVIAGKHLGRDLYGRGGGLSFAAHYGISLDVSARPVLAP